MRESPGTSSSPDNSRVSSNNNMYNMTSVVRHHDSGSSGTDTLQSVIPNLIVDSQEVCDLKAEISRHCVEGSGSYLSGSMSLDLTSRKLLVKQSQSTNMSEEILDSPKSDVSANSFSTDNMNNLTSRLSCGLSLSPRPYRKGPQRQPAISSQTTLIHERRRQYSLSPPSTPPTCTPPRSPNFSGNRRQKLSMTSRMPSDPAQPASGSISDLSEGRLSIDSEDSFTDHLLDGLGAYTRPRSTTCPESRAWKVRQKRRLANRPPTPPPL